jgi:hypothetical protein
VASRRDPAAFAGEAFRVMTNFSFYVSLRLQVQCAGWLGREGAVPEELTAGLLPQLHQAQGQVAHLLAAQASTSRLWALARRPAKDAGRGRAQSAPASRRSMKDWDVPGGALN